MRILAWTYIIALPRLALNRYSYKHGRGALHERVIQEPRARADIRGASQSRADRPALARGRATSSDWRAGCHERFATGGSRRDRQPYREPQLYLRQPAGLRGRTSDCRRRASLPRFGPWTDAAIRRFTGSVHSRRRVG